MLESGFPLARENMLSNQLVVNHVASARVLDAFSQVGREDFVPDSDTASAYRDENISLGRGRYMLEPMVLGKLLQAGAVLPTERALVVASGSGYEAAVLGFLALEVVALESDPKFAALSQEKFHALGLENVQAKEGDLLEGFASGGPWDVILLLGAFAVPPLALCAQLSPRGRLLGVSREGRFSPGRACMIKSVDSPVCQFLFDASVPLLPDFAKREVSFL